MRLLLSFLLLGLPVLTGRIVGVYDGDTVTLLTPDKRQIKVRLYGIDAPESRQAFGTKSKEHLSGLVFGKTVTVNVFALDRYGRTVGTVHVEGDTVPANLRMVRSGLAWWYRGYSGSDSTLARAERQARADRRGLWADPDPVPPWTWRLNEKTLRVGRNEAGVTAPGDTVVFNTKSRVYHCPGCRLVLSCRNCVRVLGSEAQARGGKACASCGGKCH